MSDERPCKKCGRWPDDATWWDKIPSEDRSIVAVGVSLVGLVALICILAAL